VSEEAAVLSADIEAILATMPHRYPFLMIDRVDELIPEKRGVGIKNVTINEPHFLGHFPGNPIMPGVLIIEALAQLGGIVVTGAERKRIGLLAGVNGARFRRPVRPGDQLRLEVEVLSAKRMLGKVRGVARVNGEVAAEAEILFLFES